MNNSSISVTLIRFASSCVCVVSIFSICSGAFAQQQAAKNKYRSLLVKRFMATNMSETDVSEILVPVLKAKNASFACKSSINGFLSFDSSMRSAMASQRLAARSREESLNNARRAGLPPAVIEAIAKGNQMANQAALSGAENNQVAFDNYMKSIDATCSNIK